MLSFLIHDLKIQDLIMKKTFILCVAIFLLSVSAYSQPKMIESKPKLNPVALSQETFKVKYEGGLFGFNRKQEGTLKFDDANLRLIFYSKENKEQFSIPYKAMQVIYPNTQSVQSTSGKVMQRAPLPGAGIAGMFMKDKKRYMIINFDDTDLNAKGSANFKLESRELLENTIQAIGSKAEMKQRGDSFYR